MIVRWRGWAALALAVTGALAVGAAPANADAACPTASVSGTGAGHLPGDRFPMWAGDPVTLSVDAHAVADPIDPHRATGHYTARHTRADGTLYAEWSGDITELRTAGSVAVLSGDITWANNPTNPGLPMVGTPVALTVAAGPDADRVGFTWGFSGEPVLPTQGHPPFFALDTSTLVVRSGAPGPVGVGGTAAASRVLRGTVTGPTGDGGWYRLAVAAQDGAGTFQLTRWDATGALRDDRRGAVSCLDVAAGWAVATGADSAGRAVSLTVDGSAGGDWTGWVLDQPVAPCQGALPTTPGASADLVVTG